MKSCLRRSWSIRFHQILNSGKRKQPSTRPEAWLPAAVVVQLEPTCWQELYAHAALGIARFVHNRLTTIERAGFPTGLWLMSHELEKECTPPGASVPHRPSSLRSASSWPKEPDTATATRSPAG